MKIDTWLVQMKNPPFEGWEDQVHKDNKVSFGALFFISVMTIFSVLT